VWVIWSISFLYQERKEFLQAFHLPADDKVEGTVIPEETLPRRTPRGHRRPAAFPVSFFRSAAMGYRFDVPDVAGKCYHIRFLGSQFAQDRRRCSLTVNSRMTLDSCICWLPLSGRVRPARHEYISREGLSAGFSWKYCSGVCWLDSRSCIFLKVIDCGVDLQVLNEQSTPSWGVF
jgi:hypothetical protein